MNLSHAQPEIVQRNVYGAFNVTPLKFRWIANIQYKNALLVKIPSQTFQGAYTSEPCVDFEIRARLFEMVLSDNARSHSAFQLLGYIETLRLRYGRPLLEGRHPSIKSMMPWPPIGALKDDEQEETKV